MSIQKRSFVRIISFSAAIICVLSVFAIQNYTSASLLKRQMEYSYLRAVEDLSSGLDNIRTTLNKGMYAYSSDMMTELSSKLWSDASTAKVALSQLPVEELNLESTYKFLSQVGNYSKSLAVKYAESNSLSDEDKQNIKKLHEYAQTLSDDMWTIEQRISDGELSFEETASEANNTGNKDSQTANVTEGFTDFEEGFDNYPTLIYDGPFSDHIMEKSPLMLDGKSEIDEKTALERAVRASGIEQLQISDEEKGKMPSYVFCCDNATVAITKSGGLFSYMLNYRQVGDQNVTVEQAMENATKYLNKLGIESLKSTYYEIQNGICIINYAGLEGNVTLYTDLVKIGVALDNGEIVSYDARGYITNHTQRNPGTPKLSEKQASMLISPDLTVSDISLCVIPSGGLNERYCYEFLCSDDSGQQVLVYINADTGKEEQILLLNVSENGTLTV